MMMEKSYGFKIKAHFTVSVFHTWQRSSCVKVLSVCFWWSQSPLLRCNECEMLALFSPWLFLKQAAVNRDIFNGSNTGSLILV
jgi:hypothetical protein